MTLDDYRDVWKAEDTPARQEPEPEELLARVRERSEAFERKIRRRDLLETLAAVFVAAVFGYEAATAATWLARIGAAVIVAGAAFVVWWLRRARTAGPSRDVDRPVADRLRADRERVDVQIRLLENVHWWYLAPLAAGSVLFVLGLGTGPVATSVTLAVIGAVCALVWWANRRTMRRDLRPRRRELTRLLRQLGEE